MHAPTHCAASALQPPLPESAVLDRQACGVCPAGSRCAVGLLLAPPAAATRLGPLLRPPALAPCCGHPPLTPCCGHPPLTLPSLPAYACTRSPKLWKAAVGSYVAEVLDHNVCRAYAGKLDTFAFEREVWFQGW